MIVDEVKTVRRALPGLANWLNAPPIVYAHLPVDFSRIQNKEIESPIASKKFKEILSIQPENISLLACKRSWDGEALMLRLQESNGLKTKATVKLIIPEIRLNLSFRSLEIKTLRIEKSGQWTEVDLIDEH